IEPVAGHEHDHSNDRRMLAGALGLIVGLLVAEIVVGLAASSLALLADAGHMLTDAAALALALVAASFARRPPGGSWTFGFRRVEILAALANGITLALVGIWIVSEAVLAIPDVVEVHDLHVWTVGSGFPALSAHVLVRPEGDCHEARRELAAMLAERFGLQHTTLQVEHARQQRPVGTELPLARS